MSMPLRSYCIVELDSIGCQLCSWNGKGVEGGLKIFDVMGHKAVFFLGPGEFCAALHVH